MRTEEHARALAYGEQALELFRSMGDRHNEMTGLANMSALAIRVGRLEEAAERLSESLELCLDLGADRTIAVISDIGARLAVARGEFGRGARLRGAAFGLQSSLRLSLSAEEHEDLERERQADRQRLGEQAARREWERGLALSRDGAVESLLSLLAPVRPTPNAAGLLCAAC